MTDITAAIVRELFDYDRATGQLIWRKRMSSRAAAGQIAGTIDGKGYGQIRIYGTLYRTHRLVWLHAYGELPDALIDHINHIKTDNRLENLRLATKAENNRNRKKRPATVSDMKGVTWDATREKWKAQISVESKTIYLGRYDTPIDAHQAYREAATKYYGEFANLTGQ